MAIVIAERYHNFKLAERVLRIVERDMSVLGDATHNTHMVVRLHEKRKELQAIYNSYLGWICYRDGAQRKAREYLEKSLKIREMPETLCHLAWVDIGQDRIESARENCRQARRSDIRGWCEPETVRLEAEINRLD
jgi:uncharacterized protein HemY